MVHSKMFRPVASGEHGWVFKESEGENGVQKWWLTMSHDGERFVDPIHLNDSAKGFGVRPPLSLSLILKMDKKPNNFTLLLSVDFKKNNEDLELVFNPLLRFMSRKAVRGEDDSCLMTYSRFAGSLYELFSREGLVEVLEGVFNELSLEVPLDCEAKKGLARILHNKSHSPDFLVSPDRASSASTLGCLSPSPGPSETTSAETPRPC